MKQAIGDFLLRRLEEAGIKHIFGVPGDYNLNLMQQLEDGGTLEWIGNCNELNASYATDAYARFNGLGAIIVTNGVGALSAINGIAGAYSEHAAVVCICGSLPIKATLRGDIMHHTLADREKNNFYRAFAEVTTAQAQITPENAVLEIDRLILTAWRRKLPVYMEVPSDISYLEVDVPDTPLAMRRTSSDPERLQAAASLILARLREAKSPGLLLDLDTYRFSLEARAVKLAEAFNLKVTTMSAAKGCFPENSPYYVGGYAGIASSPDVLAATDASDCLLTLGFRRVESTVGFFTDRLPASTIHLNSTYVDCAEGNFLAVDLIELLDVLLASAPTDRKAVLGKPERVERFEATDAPLTQISYWKLMENFLRPGDVFLAEDGTSSIAAGELSLPEDCPAVIQTIWGAIGYSTAALLGTIFATPGRRHILFTGEGSLQLTAQEISTMLRHDLKPFIFCINNQGYTIERTILGKDAKYNDVANWYYSQLPHVFTRDKKPETYIVTTEKELKAVLDTPHAGLVFVEAILDKNDSPVTLIRGGHAFADSDYGPRGPHRRHGAQIPLPPGV